jgi:glycosyltransferase involved in cell wall biosynthesis
VRIALFSETYLPQRNGVALILDRLVRHLAEQGHEVLLAVPRSYRPRGEVGVPAGVTVVRVPGVPLPKYPDLTVGLPFVPAVSRAVRRFRPDVIHLATEYTLGLTGLRLARTLRIPAVASFHTNIPGTLPYYGFGWAGERCWAYLRWFHNQAEATFCPSTTNRRVLEARGFRAVQVWPRGVDTERFAPRPPEPRADSARSAPLSLLYVGRLTPEKDLPVLFDAYRLVAASGVDPVPHLVLAGDGAYSARMRARAPRGVTFAGYLDGAELSAAYAAADVFVFPSRVETLGNVVLEALASGLPVVGAAEGGTLENVRDGVNGVLCPPGDAAAFAAAIARLAADGDLRRRLSANARQWAEQRTWERAFAPLVATYEELASR